MDDGDYFTLGTGVITTAPGGISGNLQVWLKADAEVTGGSAVTDWADQSGGGNDFSQSDSDLRPSLTAEAINFNPAIDFDGSVDRLEDDDGESYIEGNDALSTFVAVDSDDATEDKYIFLTSSDSSLAEAPWSCLLYTSPSPRDRTRSRMPSSA